MLMIIIILLLIGAYIAIAIHDQMHPNDIPKIDNYWEIDESLRKYKEDYFLNYPIRYIR